MMPFQLQRLGIVMEADPRNAREAGGVLNPGGARGPDGQLYLFPRFAAQGNFSRIGIARVRFNNDGDPIGVERLGIALEPEAEYELAPTVVDEDPRITFVEEFDRYVMSYTGPDAPARELPWRLPMISFIGNGSDFATFRASATAWNVTWMISQPLTTKMLSSSPTAIYGPTGENDFAMIHRPLFPGTDAPEMARASEPRSQMSPSRTSGSHIPRANLPIKISDASATFARITAWLFP